jgi:Mn-dependent DtxR family transcriptional regulator
MLKMDNEFFYTFNEYMKKDDSLLTASMEDYLEMIYRLSLNTGFTRIHELSQTLNVQPPSATKMVQRLSQLHLLKYEKYGVLILEEEGRKLGAELLRRHLIIEDFIRIIGVDNAKILEEAEKIEHTLSQETTNRFEDFVAFIRVNPDIITRYAAFMHVRNRQV